MKPAWKKYLHMRAPRYTSYPSALHFDKSVTPDDYCARLQAIGLYEPLSLYVHVPFCKQLCWYCGCNMRIENCYERAARYVEFLTAEIRLVGDKLRGNGRPVCVHFGGGTPNYLTIDDISKILQAIELELGLTDQSRLAIELDPRLLTRDYIDDLAGLGFQRMSLGVQDFDPYVQKAINRVQSYDLLETCVSQMSQAGVKDISFDLLYGLPRQTEVSFNETMKKVVSLSPDRICVFGYAHMPDALRRQRLINSQELPDNQLRYDLASLADEALLSEGYCRIGFDHFAKPDNVLVRAARCGRLNRNFQGFTDDTTETVLGFGASAISFAGGLYAQNEKQIRGYCERISIGALPTVRGLVRTPGEDAVAKAVSALLCHSEADISELLSALSSQEVNSICGTMEGFERDGIIRWNGDSIALADEAIALSRIVAMGLDPYHAAGSRLAQAV